MTASLGVFHDCLKYADNFDLPITFVIEDNGLSTDTKTSEVWNRENLEYIIYLRNGLKNKNRIIGYSYERKYPHYGTGVFVASLWKDLVDDARSKGF